MRTRLIVLLLVVTLVACGSGGSAKHATAPSTTTSTPTSRPPFAVGMRTLARVDPSRPTPANGDYAGAPSRTLDTLVMYPAQGAPGGDPQTDAPPIDGQFP